MRWFTDTPVGCNYILSDEKTRQNNHRQERMDDLLSISFFMKTHPVSTYREIGLAKGLLTLRLP